MATDNPGRKEVTAPFDREQRDIDVERKLQWYGIVEGFSNGKIPSNRQIDVAMNSAIDSDLLRKPSTDLSKEGRLLVQDLRNVLNEAKILLLSKNREESIQQFVYLTSNADPQVANNIDAPVSKDVAKRDGDKALDSLKTLGMLMITNGQFRKLINDIGLLAQDMTADAVAKAQSAAGISPERIRPDGDKLQQIDEPAPDNTWHDKPDFEGAKAKAKDMVGTVKNAAQQQKERAQQADGVVSDGQAREAQEKKDEGANKAQQKKDELQDKAGEKKEQLKQDTKDYLEEKIPEERRDAAIERLKKMVVEIQDHEDYNDAIETLLDLAESYQGYAQDVTGQAAGAAEQTAKSDDKLKLAWVELKKTLEYFANSSSTDDIFDAINDVYRDADRDPQFKQWFKDIDRYIRRVLKETGYILSDDADKQFEALRKRGKDFAENRYSEHYDRVIDEFKRWGDQFEKDPLNQRFGQTVQKLLDDLGTDRKGQATFKKHLLKDVTNVIIPGIFRRVNYVPLPRIEIIDPQFDAVIENLILDGANIIPNIIEIENHNFLKYSAYKRINNNQHHKFTIKLSQIQLDIKDIAYYIKRKQGFPSITDTGVVDILLSGNGLSATIGLETAEKKDRQAFFKPADIHVSIHHMDVKLRKSTHKVLFAFFKPLLMSTLKPVIAKVAEQQIRSNLTKFDAQIYALHKKVQAEKEKAKEGDPEGAAQDLKLYFEQIKARFLENKRQKEARAKQTTVNVAATLEGSKLQNKKLPGITSTTATKMKQRAREGKTWHSSIFDIGSAKPSTNVPAPKAISRKSPNDRATLNASEHPDNMKASAAAGGKLPENDGNFSGSRAATQHAATSTTYGAGQTATTGPQASYGGIGSSTLNTAAGEYAYTGAATSGAAPTLPASSAATFEAPGTDGLAPPIQRY